MTIRSEQLMENNLVHQLKELGYQFITIKGEAELLANLKTQLEKHNKVTLTQSEFDRVLNHLHKGNVFQRAKILRDKMELERENGDTLYLSFLELEHWCQNEFQVTNQVTLQGTYKNRYDVTILINGLPLVHLELKRSGLEIKEAFNQINRYQRHSFPAAYGLFQYVQIFVISNEVNTKYYANNKTQSFKQTFYWADQDNQKKTNLSEFAAEFLEPCHLAKMICKYIVLHESDKILMVLRPYQYHAVEAIIDRVKNSVKNGYIWHTTGSGKTLTSFKAAQIITQLPQVQKVVFVVDRKDLDYQTIKEFNSFKKGSVDGTDNTQLLVKQFEGNTKLIVTTIQKLNNTISKKRYLKRMEGLQDQSIVFIFDECHRSQFGDTHQHIVQFFRNSQLFGFTGTPIFADNKIKNRTTKDLFEECLHKYVITDAIRDENVLKFSVEYIGKYKRKDSKNEIDIAVKSIDTKEAMDAPKRLHKIADYILQQHDTKTHHRDFNAIFCVSGIPVLCQYYDYFQEQKEAGKHSLKIATIFSYGTNEDDQDTEDHAPKNKKQKVYEMPQSDENPSIAAEEQAEYKTKHSREKLDQYIADYNVMFGTKYSTKDTETYYNYYKDVSKRVKKREIDILLVVGMFLTGFDSKTLNTLYVDKNLQYHGLIQAYSRTNRILGERKSQGNIVCFRNLKENTDQAVALFSNKNAKEEIFLEPYEEYVKKFNIVLILFFKLVPTVDSVNTLKDEEQELEFVTTFRKLLRVKNILESFADFKFADLNIEEQTFEDYKSKYLDLYDKVKTGKGTGGDTKTSILDEVDFELELIHRDEINVAYILNLLAKLKGESKESKKQKLKDQIFNILGGEAKLRSKRKLIEKFIEENLPNIENPDDIADEFEAFWKTEQAAAFLQLCESENLDPAKLQAVISKYLFTQRPPRSNEIIDMVLKKLTLRERRKTAKRVLEKVMEFVEVFLSGVGE